MPRHDKPSPDVIPFTLTELTFGTQVDDLSNSQHFSSHVTGGHCLGWTSVKQIKGASAWDFQQSSMRDQQSLRSPCAYAQSDQSLC